MGPNFSRTHANMQVNGLSVPWCKSLCYLGHTILSGTRISCDFHPAKAKFFGTTNSIFSKIGGSAPINVLLSLLYTKCIPALTYAMEAISLNKTLTNNLSHVYNSIFFKIFSSFDKDVIKQCQYYCGYLPFSYYYTIKRLKFLAALKDATDSLPSFLLKWVGKREMISLEESIGIANSTVLTNFKKEAWRHFSGSLNLVAG